MPEKEEKAIYHIYPKYRNTMYTGNQYILYDKECLTEKQTRPSYSKLRTSLVNISLKIQMLLAEIRQYFSLKKNVKSLIFTIKNISVFGYKVIKYLPR